MKASSPGERRTHLMALSVALAALLMLGVLVWFMLTSDRPEPDPIIAMPVPIPVENVAPERVQSAAPRPSPQEESRALIEQYEADVDRDPRDADSAAKLFAAANLYRQKFTDYAAAAKIYERILADYPQWNRLSDVYIQLSTCYERGGMEQEAAYLYEEIMEEFPAENPIHQYALEKLGS